MSKLQHLRTSDVAAVAKLATAATVGISHIAEGVNQSVWNTLGRPAGQSPGQTRGITGLVYQSVRGVTHLIGRGLDAALTGLQPLFDAADKAAPETPQREAVLAALNGVMGDRLAASNNPLATPMSLRHQGHLVRWPEASRGSIPTGKILLLVHGLCMNDLQWKTHHQHSPDGSPRQIQDHGASLAAQLDYTPIYLRYNTGLHTSENGLALSHQLAQMVAEWPVPVEEISVLAHSMGGLVVRSAVHQATHHNAPPGRRLSNKNATPWTTYLKNIVFLGTPHHGAPLERAGNWVDVLLGSSPYAKPFARLVQLRSAGITDLRYGHVLDADWQGHDRFRKRPDSRLPAPLPPGVACFAVAATTAAKRSLLADRLVGDGLVPLQSALGQHPEPGRTLTFPKASQMIAYRTHHMQLLSSPDVAQQIVAWLKPV